MLSGKLSLAASTINLAFSSDQDLVLERTLRQSTKSINSAFRTSLGVLNLDKKLRETLLQTEEKSLS